MKNRVEKQVSTGKTNRFMELEGLRGLAALTVFLFHFLIIFYPVMYYGVSDQAPIQHFWLEDNIHGTPLATFLSGTFSVAIFFVLSGFVLSVGFFTTKNTAVIKKLASKRYLRLMLPALASVILAWIYIKLNLSKTVEAYHISLSSALHGEWSMVPHLLDAIKEGMINIFVVGGTGHHYNNVLWTMKYEFVGSFIVFTLALIFGHSNKRWIIYAALALGLYSTWYLGFILGMALADVYVNKPQLIKKIKRPFFYGLLAIGIILGGFPTAYTADTFYDHLNLSWLMPNENQSLYMSLGALFIVMSVLSIGFLRRIMSLRFMSQLGKYTYSLYLVHQPIIYTLGAGLFVMFTGFMGYNRSVALAIACTIPVIALATYLFHRFVEIPSINFASYFEQVYTGQREINLKQKYAVMRLNLAAKMSLLRRPKATDIMPEIEAE